jgi:two-component system cell cycle response regulator
MHSANPTGQPAAAPAPRILVVDDGQRMREHLLRTLTAAGFSALGAADGIDALEVLHRTEPAPDLILTDIHMPRMNGLSLIECVRNGQRGRDIPIILLSGSHETSFKVAGLECGANDYVTKPVDAAELVARIRAQLRQAETVAKLREQAVVDELTGVRNRRGMVQAMDTELARAQRSRRPLSVLLIDVDKFKPINDCFGHLVGDAVLRGIAERISGIIRTTDIVGRIGGDEFLLLLPEVDREVAETVADRIRGAATSVRVGPRDNPTTMSVSIGLSVYRGDGRTADALIHDADAAMYRDKQQKRAALVPAAAAEAAAA